MNNKIKKLIEFKLDILSATRKTLLKPYVTGTIREQQQNQAFRIEKELAELKVNPKIIAKA